MTVKFKTCLQVCSYATLVPQQAIVSKLDCRNKFTFTLGFSLISEKKNKRTCEHVILNKSCKWVLRLL